MYSGAEICEISMTNIEIYFWHVDRAMYKIPLVPDMITNEI